MEKFGGQLSINSDEHKGRGIAGSYRITSADFNIKRIVTNKRKPKGSCRSGQSTGLMELFERIQEDCNRAQSSSKAIVKREEQILKLVTDYTAVDPLLLQRLLFLRYIQTHMAKLHHPTPDDEVEVVFQCASTRSSSAATKILMTGI
uniref:Uncharacterized protein n=1 Tax=Ditylenchus dipsaci TaxID=166011 RepID=A0A915CNM2_9BILA